MKQVRQLVHVSKYNINVRQLQMTEVIWVLTLKSINSEEYRKIIIIIIPTLRWLLFFLAALLPGSRSKENLEFKTLKSTPERIITQMYKHEW